jgi:hypothetical protein
MLHPHIRLSLTPCTPVLSVLTCHQPPSPPPSHFFPRWILTTIAADSKLSLKLICTGCVVSGSGIDYFHCRTRLLLRVRTQECSRAYQWSDLYDSRPRCYDPLLCQPCIFLPFHLRFCCLALHRHSMQMDQPHPDARRRATRLARPLRSTPRPCRHRELWARLACAGHHSISLLSTGSPMCRRPLRACTAPRLTRPPCAPSSLNRCRIR